MAYYVKNRYTDERFDNITDARKFAMKRAKPGKAIWVFDGKGDNLGFVKSDDDSPTGYTWEYGEGRIALLNRNGTLNRRKADWIRFYNNRMGM